MRTRSTTASAVVSTAVSSRLVREPVRAVAARAPTTPNPAAPNSSSWRRRGVCRSRLRDMDWVRPRDNRLIMPKMQPAALALSRLPVNDQV